MKLACVTDKQKPSRGAETFESIPRKLVFETCVYSWKDNLIWPRTEFLQHLYFSLYPAATPLSFII